MGHGNNNKQITLNGKLTELVLADDVIVIVEVAIPDVSVAETTDDEIGT